MTTTTRNSFRAIAFIASSSICSTAFAGPGKGNGGGKGGDDNDRSTPVCASIGDAGNLEPDYAALAYCDGVDGIEALIGHGGRFRLDAGDSPRQAVVNFPGCDRLIATSSGDCRTNVIFNTLAEWVHEEGIGFMPTGAYLDLEAMPQGSDALVDFLIAFPSSISRSTPHLVFFGGSNMGADACGEPLTVTRVDAAQWIIRASNRTGCLFEVMSKNGKREVTDSFELSFSITIDLR